MDLQPGANFVLKKDEALKKAERVITVLSPDYLNAASTQTDWAAAFSQDPGTLLPVRVRKCDPKGLLGPITCIELVGLNEPLARLMLLSGVSRGRNKPTSAPLFPGELQEAASGRPHFPGYLRLFGVYLPIMDFSQIVRTSSRICITHSEQVRQD